MSGINPWADDNPVKRASRTAPLGAVCLVVVCILLSLGLWPFHAPLNQVEWLINVDGLAFGRWGTVRSEGTFQIPASEQGTYGSSIEVWVQPRPYRNSAALLAFHGGIGASEFHINQSISDLRLDTDHKRLYASDVFRATGPSFLTITCGESGTRIYVDGVLTATAARIRVPKEVFTGQLLLGDSPRQPDSWRGTILGLALYDSELNASRVFRHYDTWTKNRHPEIEEDDRTVALYFFDEREGRIAHSKITPAFNLLIPERYSVVDKVFMEPFWHEFIMTRSYWSAALKNIIGFVPLGFCLYPYLSVHRVRKAALLTVVFGTVVSITIEVLQAFLPTRDSGTTDILTNTFGTWMGVWLYRRMSPILFKRFSWLESSDVR